MEDTWLVPPYTNDFLVSPSVASCLGMPVLNPVEVGLGLGMPDPKLLLLLPCEAKLGIPDPFIPAVLSCCGVLRFDAGFVTPSCELAGFFNPMDSRVKLLDVLPTALIVGIRDSGVVGAS